MDRSNGSPTQYLTWCWGKQKKRIPVRLVSTGIWTLNSPNTSPVCWISIGACIRNLITYRNSQSAGAGIWASNFNRCNDATVRTREVRLVHASSLLYRVNTVASSNKWFTICGNRGKRTLWTSLYLRRSSFPNPSVASPTSQFILQPFFRFSYVIGSSLTSPSELPMFYWLKY